MKSYVLYFEYDDSFVITSDLNDQVIKPGFEEDDTAVLKSLLAEFVIILGLFPQGIW